MSLTPAIQSRLPHVGTTIFSTMSALAQQHGAVNLGQGFPDFDCDPALVEAVHQAMRAGHNQYPLMSGVPALRQAIAAKMEALYGQRYDADREITVTAGATQALLSTLLATVHPGDEVIVLEPCYDAYGPAIELAGGRVVRVKLKPESYRPDLPAIAAALTPRTRALMINTPHNPSGRIWPAEDLQALSELLAGTEVLVISDEVYEHMVFDGRQHQSAALHPGLAARSFVVSSFGKTYHVTGWKVGYVAAPAALTAEFRKIHQFNVFTVNTPVQHGLATYLRDPRPYLDLPAFYQRKRDLFRAGLASTRLRLLPCEGTYFQSVDYSDVGAASGMAPEECCRWLTQEIGVAAIPLSAFYAEPGDDRLIRFCFAKKDETLQAALDQLRRL
ncbi:pyridoxal phosphate-dependent aminotransferase [Mitsuaria sp. WAJ17]|uniref:pyridoxal phosphate-dependent aminotransferase n=1 Tax=Mitsuaria sp. WAJ17 TaxID=2761452 RepID=UPI0016027C85|nr:pyridoxal phosphate-dependent aminotransferase [Mitsuaria sp. WAJ17]MBB2485539.1 pyridoxal phosphate-dependent aminotransferase [Mitsuaria sp. WAJ17]